MSKANGKGLSSTSHRSKTREAKDWTGRSPLTRRLPFNPDHAEHIEFLLDAWQQGELDMVSEYSDVLLAQGYSPSVVQSILAQGTQGMPG